MTITYDKLVNSRAPALVLNQTLAIFWQTIEICFRKIMNRQKCSLHPWQPYLDSYS